MSSKIVRYLTHFLTIAGLSLMLVGGLMWWRQSGLEAALLNQEERILLAVTAEASPPSTLPESPEEAEPTISLPTLTPTPEISSTASARVDDAARASSVSPTPTETATPAPTPTPDPFPPADSVPARVVAPAINLDANVVEMGWAVKQDANGNKYSEWVVPQFAAGWHKNSGLPGHGGNTVLSGHHNVHGEVFRHLVDLEPGDEVMLEADGINYRYQVQEKYIVKEKGESIEVRRENNRYIQETEDERLTLVTCWPYETNTHRVIVIARPIIEGSASAADDG